VYRVDRVEGVMNMVLTKVEQILGRLDTVTRSQTLRHANMAKLFDDFTEHPECKLTHSLLFVLFVTLDEKLKQYLLVYP
jgi:hypothetical protein